MSRDFLPVLPTESVMEAIEDLQSEAEAARESLGDLPAAQISHALATARMDALDDVWQRMQEVKHCKVRKEALEEDDENYYKGE